MLAGVELFRASSAPCSLEWRVCVPAIVRLVKRGRYERALVAKQQSLGEQHFSVGHTLYNLACLMLDDERLPDAAGYMRRTLDIYLVTGETEPTEPSDLSQPRRHRCRHSAQ